MTVAEKIIVDLTKQSPTDTAALDRSLRRLFNSHSTAPLPKATLIYAYRQLIKRRDISPDPRLEKFLIKNAVRTLSGVTVITVLTKPYLCPGKCVFCPTEPNMPKSYLSNEPAAQRAVRNKFHPFDQVVKRIEALEANGHDVDKLEIIVLGGTWSAYRERYQTWFITQCFYAANTYDGKPRRAKSLAAEQKINEKTRYKIIGLTLETRPDHVTPKEIKRLRLLGCTRVQLGIQHIENKILELNRRGEVIEDSVRATELLKQTGFKVDHHYMPDLPGSTPDKDRAMFQEVYYGENLQPDQVKIYPCVVNEYAQLYHWYKSGKYKPYPEKDLIQLLKDIKKMTPPYVRINRLVRDIPEESIIAGNDVTNLRQFLQQQLIKEGAPCRCIRCREVRDQAVDAHGAVLKNRAYRASNGQEYFISFESPDERVIFGFVRLRFNDKAKHNFIPELRDAALVRELHVYGLMIPVDTDLGRGKHSQHLGFGKRLMLEAENVSRASGFKKIAVISGIGTREYYRKLGYRLQGTYMVKKII